MTETQQSEIETLWNSGMRVNAAAYAQMLGYLVQWSGVELMFIKL